MKGNVKSRFILYRRNGTFYSEDTQTRKQQSLRTKDPAAAEALIHSKNEAFRQPILNQQIALAYLSATDADAAKRQWRFVMNEMTGTKQKDTRARYITAWGNHAFDIIRDLPLIETRADHILKVLRTGTVSTNVYLRRLHNFALDMNWLPKSLVPRRQWPKPVFKAKRAITLAEVSAIARFDRVDPLANSFKTNWLATPQKMNLYSYCGNMPLVSVDCSGHDGVKIVEHMGNTSDVVVPAYEAGHQMSQGNFQGACETTVKAAIVIQSSVLGAAANAAEFAPVCATTGPGAPACEAIAGLVGGTAAGFTAEHTPGLNEAAAAICRKGGEF